MLPTDLAIQAARDVASRASSLEEQVHIAEALTADGVSPPEEPLTALESWKLPRIAAGLVSSDARRTSPARRSPETLEAVLRLNRRLGRRSRDLTTRERSVLEGVHGPWIATYVAAFEEFVAEPPGPGRPPHPSPARRRLALACAPFRAILRRRIQDAVAGANRAARGDLFDPSFVDAHEDHLVSRLELALAWAVEADENVALARSGLTRDGADLEDHERYYAGTFGDPASYHTFYARFPVLARWLATLTRQLASNGAEMVKRLHADAAEIGRALFGQSIEAFTSVDLGRSDPHAGGRSVAIVHVTLGSGRSALVYKPRDLGAEVAVQGLVERLAADGVAGLVSRRIIARDGYGYEQRIRSDRNHVASLDEARRVFEELGAFLGIFHVLGGSDLHYENVIVEDGHVHVCDCETALAVTPPGQEPPGATILGSVFRTGLLEWPRPPSGDAVAKLGGIGGGESYEVPFATPRVSDAPSPVVRHEIGFRVEQEPANRVRLDGELLDPADFEDSIVRGFTRVHRWFESDPRRAAECVGRLFADTHVRYVARPTQTYSALLTVACHPRCLMEPLEVDLVHTRLEEELPAWDERGLVTSGEVRSLWQLDVPLFSARAAGTELLRDGAEGVSVRLDRSPLAATTDRIRNLSSEDRLQQVRYISASLSHDDVHSASFVQTAVEYARLVGEELCRVLERPQPPDYTPKGSEVEAGVRGSLYYGDAGIALFLAYLDSICPDERVRRAAELAAANALVYGETGPGAFQGAAGMVYLCTHLHHLWGAPRWLDLAVGRARSIAGMVTGDRAFDVLTGSAGVIPVMLGLAGVSGDGLATAHRCADHLLRHAESRDGTLSWPLEQSGLAVANLTGFAHGAGGIGWALVLLGAATSRGDYVDAGKRAFAYEALHFDDEQKDWFDLRTVMLARTNGRRHFGNAWCNGAAGIGLSRLGSWAALGGRDDALLRDAYLALSATLRNFAKLGNDTLCHGTCGNAELFLRFARLRDEPAYQLEANVQAQAQWRRVSADPTWPAVGREHRRMPGLMVGMAGAGMHFLRLAHPDRVPSPLVLDPPVT